MTAHSLVRMGCELSGDIPDGVDVDKLVIMFALDGETITDDQGRTRAWVGMDTAPVVGDVILSQALGLEAGDAYTVSGRGWIDHNLLNVHIVKVGTGEQSP